MMPWFRVDDSFHDHPKVFDAPDCAVALWTRAGTWSAHNLTDGFVPSAILDRFTSDPDTAARELVRRGLWLRAKGGFQFHDWHDYQPTKEAVENERKMKTERQRRWREAKRRRSGRQPVDASTAPSRDASTDGAPPPPRPEGSGAGKPAPGGARSRASPPGSLPRAEWPSWCGTCDERTRMLLDENQLPSTDRCPRCHPRAEPSYWDAFTSNGTATARARSAITSQEGP